VSKYVIFNDLKSYKNDFRGCFRKPATGAHWFILPEQSNNLLKYSNLFSGNWKWH